MWKQVGALLLCSAATVRGVPVLPADTRLDPAASASSPNLEVRNAALEAKLEGAKAKADLEVKLAKSLTGDQHVTRSLVGAVQNRVGRGGGVGGWERVDRVPDGSRTELCVHGAGYPIPCMHPCDYSGPLRLRSVSGILL